VFDLVHLSNDAPIVGKKSKSETPEFPTDEDGSKTPTFLTNTRSVVWRLCSNHASSLGLHPALYFYSRSGVFQPAAFLSFVLLFKNWDTNNFVTFTQVRAEIEKFLLQHRGISEALRRLGSGGRSRPRIISLYKKLIADFEKGKTQSQVYNSLRRSHELGHRTYGDCCHWRRRKI